ncbi:nuclear transport factor 2 family protein [Massilia sp. G4R7]|uniref:Nuclear transport factor 2 family protein n=1 Tax=Massilia phyllostachyos TaxID=2898585 RepID=A0ABS8QA48_9BURK|nr:nuclear transport factor 2 family protein [Massilia phyllostachyos]MCD2518627.1 nuclear transport factor 2 family protein [Massilia phyllostachyos]
MKSLTGIALCLAMQLLPAPGRAAVQNDRPAAATETPAHVQSVLQALERQRATAILQRDIPTLRSLMDRQYAHIESRGRARSKTELLTALERGDFRFRVYENESIEVQLLDNGGAALVTGIFRSLLAEGSAKPFRGRFVRIWVRQGDGWKNTYHQTTEIRPAQSSCPCE